MESSFGSGRGNLKLNKGRRRGEVERNGVAAKRYARQCWAKWSFSFSTGLEKKW
jgi:hypothetical protein